jgi:hypothetical protein
MKSNLLWDFIVSQIKPENEICELAKTYFKLFFDKNNNIVLIEYENCFCVHFDYVKLMFCNLHNYFGMGSL